MEKNQKYHKKYTERLSIIDPEKDTKHSFGDGNIMFEETSVRFIYFAHDNEIISNQFKLTNTYLCGK